MASALARRRPLFRRSGPSPKLMRLQRAMATRGQALRRKAMERKGDLIELAAAGAIGYAERSGMLASLPTFGVDPVIILAALSFAPGASGAAKAARMVGQAAGVIGVYKFASGAPMLPGDGVSGNDWAPAE